MQFLPFADDSFDVVAGFNSFFFAADLIAALREAGRVAKPGAPVVIQVWGRPERCHLDAMKPVTRPLLPAPPPGAPPAPALWQPGVLEGLAAEAGLRPQTAYDVSWAYEIADGEALGRAMISAGGLSVAAGEREDEVRQAIVEALAPYRQADGSYRLENEWHTLIALS
jgi:SAM-dependent methyltransferase